MTRKPELAHVTIEHADSGIEGYAHADHCTAAGSVPQPVSVPPVSVVLAYQSESVPVPADNTASTEQNEPQEVEPCGEALRQQLLRGTTGMQEPLEDPHIGSTPIQTVSSKTNEEPTTAHEQCAVRRRATEEHTSWCEAMTQPRSHKITGGNMRLQ